MKCEPIQKDIIVIGSSLSALVYAYCHGYSFFSTKFKSPHEFDFFSPDLDLSLYGVLNYPKELKSPSGQTKTIGIQKHILWHRLNAILSFASKNIMPFEISQIKIEENTLKIITNRGRMATYLFSKLIIFDEDKVDLPITLMPSTKFKIYDWIDIKSGQNIPYNFIDTDGDLVRNMWFYGTNRNANKNLKDVVSVSYATYDNLNTFEWTDTGAMFKTKNIMKKNGLRGRRNGRDTKYPTKYKYYAIQLLSTKRDVEPLREGENIYIDNIEIRYDNDEQLIRSLIIQPSDVTKLNYRFMNAQNI